jgi:hypothetical protein
LTGISSAETNVYFQFIFAGGFRTQFGPNGKVLTDQILADP